MGSVGAKGCVRRLTGWGRAQAIRRLASRKERRAATVDRYLPSVSIFRFSSSFIFLTAGSRLTSPVVWLAVAGGLLLGIEVCPVGTEAGRVAVVLGAVLFCAIA